MRVPYYSIPQCIYRRPQEKRKIKALGGLKIQMMERED